MRDIPFAALSDETQDAFLSSFSGDEKRLITGSVTASVSDESGFVVESRTSGSQFTGSLFISGGIEINSGSSFSGSGAKLFDIPRSALTQDALLSALIVSGAVTASTENDVFTVTSVDNGYIFSGSVLVSGSIITDGGKLIGDGSELTNVAITQIASG